MKIAKDLQINEEIRDPVVLLVGGNGPLGNMSSREALSKAIDCHLDLVKISPNANPPVCKLMDYGKYCFEQKKKEKEAKKKQHVVELKEIRLSCKIDIGDLTTKSKRAEEFISKGNKVKINIRFRGREISNPDLGTEVMNRFCDLCKDFASPEGKFSREGRNMFLILSKKKSEEKAKYDKQQKGTVEVKSSEEVKIAENVDSKNIVPPVNNVNDETSSKQSNES